MNWASGKRCRRRDGERGAVLVEFAFVALLLFGLIFGVIEFGFHFNDQQSVRQGARDAARAAVVNNYPSACTGSTPTSKLVCTTLREVGLVNARTYVMVDATAPGTSSANDHGTVTVCVKYQTKSLTGFFPFLNNKYLTTRVQMRLETEASEALTDYQDTLPAGGGNWSFCNA